MLSGCRPLRAPAPTTLLTGPDRAALQRMGGSLDRAPKDNVILLGWFLGVTVDGAIPLFLSFGVVGIGCIAILNGVRMLVFLTELRMLHTSCSQDV